MGAHGHGSVKDTDKGAKALGKRLAAKAAELKVGLLEAAGAEAKEGSNDGATLLDIATFHEFGLGVPRRSFIADWSDENEGRHKQQIRTMAKAIVKGSVESSEIGLARLGNLYVGEVQRRISQGIEPELAGESIDIEVMRARRRSSGVRVTNVLPSKRARPPRSVPIHSRSWRSVSSAHTWPGGSPSRCVYV